MDIKPAEGKLAVEFLDDDEEETTGVTGMPKAPEDDEALMAVVMGVGAKVTGVKKGDVAVLRSWARSNGVKVDGNTYLIDSHYLLGTVAK